MLNSFKRLIGLNGLHVIFSIALVLNAPLTLFSNPGQIKFQSISIENGLSQNFVQCIYKDKKGFMWIGTRDGLNRYDGYRIITYRHDPSNPKSISNNFINDIIEDKDGNLIIGTSKGLNKWNRADKSFTRYDRPANPYTISDLMLDSKRRVWAATVNAGLLLFNPVTGKFHSYLQKDAKSNNIHKVFEFGDGVLWLASRAGLDEVNIRAKRVKRFKTDSGNSKMLGASIIRDIYRDSKGVIWLGVYRKGLARYNKEDKSFTSYNYTPAKPEGITDAFIWAISEGADGKLWLGTETKGICVFDYKTGKSVSYGPDVSNRFSLNHRWVRTLYKDKSGNVWIGTQAGGVNLRSKTREKFKHITGTGGQTD